MSVESKTIKYEIVIVALNQSNIYIYIQGQENQVIIISTVLSNRVPTYERNGSLGLFGDEK